jgi:hypothetical protein
MIIVVTFLVRFASLFLQWRNFTYIDINIFLVCQELTLFVSLAFHYGSAQVLARKMR